MHRKPFVMVTPDTELQNTDLWENQRFLQQLQEALLLGLAGQGLLTREQYERCTRELSRRFKRDGL